MAIQQAQEARNIKVDQQGWTPNMQLVNAYFTTRQEASKAIYNNMELKSETLELITDDMISWIVDKTDSDEIRTQMETYREKEYKKIKEIVFKRREYLNEEQFTNTDYDLCWKKACIKTIGLVHKWYGKYLNIDGQENTIGCISQWNHDPEGKPLVFIGKDLIKKLSEDGATGYKVKTDDGAMAE